MNNNEKNTILTQTLTYQPELANQLFSQLEHLPWAMLLRSASDTHMDSRFDILVISGFRGLMATIYGDQ